MSKPLNTALDESSGDEGPRKRTFKVTVLGDGAVGKSSICNRFCKDFFAREYKQTLGLDFFSQSLTLANGQEVSYNLFDIGGQSLTSKLLKTYAQGSDAALLVFDMTSLESLSSLTEWVKQAQLPASCKVVTVANKSDMASKRQTTIEQIEAVRAQVCAVEHYQVSALTGDRIKMMFVGLAGLMLGLDLEAEMLEERNVTQAVVKEEDQKTAVLVNETGSMVAKQSRTYQVVSDGSLEGLTAEVVQQTQVKPKKKGRCFGM